MNGRTLLIQRICEIRRDLYGENGLESVARA